MISRELPHATDVEREVLGCAILDPSVLHGVLEILRPDDFYHTAHKIIYRTMVDLDSRNDKIDLVTLVETLRLEGALDEAGGLAYVSSLPDHVASVSHADSCAKVVKDRSLVRQVITTARVIESEAFGGVTDAAEFIDACQAQMFSLSDAQASPLRADIGLALVDALGDLQKLATEGVVGLKTGIGDLDRTFYGFLPQDLVVLAGRPGTGKTGFAVAILQEQAIIERSVVGFFSLEMGVSEILKRILLQVSREVVKPNVPIADMSSLRSAAKEIEEAKDRILIDDSPMTTPQQIKAKARRWKAQFGLDMVIIDYLQLISNPLKDRNREQEVSDISRQMFFLAKELNIPVLLLSQLNRQSELRENKRPRLADLRESGAIEQDAKKVLFIFHDKDGTFIDVAKHRNGPRGLVRIHYDMETQTFSDYIDDDYWGKSRELPEYFQK